MTDRHSATMKGAAMTEATDGEWGFVEGEPGFMGSLEEPPEPAYPPSIVAHMKDGRPVEIAHLTRPIPEPNDYDPESGEVEMIGSEATNGQIMAAAKDMLAALETALPVLKELPSIAPAGYPIGGGALEPVIFEVERAIKKAKGGEPAEIPADFEQYLDYKRAGGIATYTAWHRVWRMHMQYIDSDRLSPFEEELKL